MVTAVILSGGVGTRFSLEGAPKQYRMVRGRPVIMWVLEGYQKSDRIDKILIVAAQEWRPFLDEWISKEHIDKFAGYAEPGAFRQASMVSGMKAARAFMEDDDVVIFHEAARPLVTGKLIADCLDAAKGADGAVASTPSVEAVCLSEDGEFMSGLWDRSKLYVLQTPECYVFGKYYALNMAAKPSELEASIAGMFLAFYSGMRVAMFRSHRHNFKITTMDDLGQFEAYLREEAGDG